MNKLLYAINHRQTEDAISAQLNDDYLPVGAVTYKEAVLENLRSTGANILLMLESLPGSSNFSGLVKQIRVELPDVRIVVICTKREKSDPFLANLVNIGIYDIINSDSPMLSEIISYITTPRSYRDAAQYGIGLPEIPANSLLGGVAAAGPSAKDDAAKDGPGQEIKKRGLSFFSDLKKGFSALSRPHTSAATDQGSISAPETAASEYDPLKAAPQVNVELLRDSIRESEARRAQENLDRLIREAVAAETAQLRTENEALNEQLAKIQTDISIAESHASGTTEELNRVRSEKDRLSILLTDTRRDMQQIIDTYEAQLKALHNPTNTPEWYAEQQALWEESKRALTKNLQDKSAEADDLRLKCELLTKQVQDNSAVIATMQAQLERAKSVQSFGRDADEAIAKLRAEASEAKSMQVQLETELERARKQLAIMQEGGPDYSLPNVEVPLLPDDTVYTGVNESPQTILVLGAKHGVGATTTAINLAASLSARGYKTLLAEINSRYPLCNQFFEFTHVPYGVEEAISAVAQGDFSGVDRSIIRPHGLRPAQTNLYKTYQMLPPGMHFMIPSNESMVAHSYERNPSITQATVYTLLNCLVKKEQYSHVILDVQCDDERMINAILTCGYTIDKLCIVLSQDPHAMATAGRQITSISRLHMSSLVAAGEFIINKYNPNAPINQKKIEQMLHISNSQITRLTEDSVGHLTAAGHGLPYILNKGCFWSEYESLGVKISPQA